MWWELLAQQERMPELRFPAAYDTYDDMMTNAQVSSVLRAVMMPILRTGWRIDGTGCRPEITEHVAGDMSLPIVGQGNEVQRGSAEERFSWAEHLDLALEEMLGYGHSFYEQKAYLGDDGFWHLQKLGYRPPRTITKIHVARDGGLVALEQTPGPMLGRPRSTDLTPRQLPVRRVVVYVHGRKGGNWRGRSLLRPAYVPWLLNQRAKRVEMITAERAGSPVVVYVGAEGETDLTAGEKIATRVRAGQTAGVAVPHGAEILLKGVEGTLPDLHKTKQYNDEQIARGVLAHFLNLGSQTGSWALGSTFADFFTLSLQAVADEVARIASRH
ncbi:MAG: phage portal protein family protein, partial [Actinomycetes bacterium]